MNKQTLLVIVGALVLFGVALGGALAFTGGSESKGHTMPNGQTTTGQMTQHTMEDGKTMTGMTMTTP